MSCDVGELMERLENEQISLLGGHVAQAARRLATCSTTWVRSRVSEAWRFSLLLRIQTAPGVHSAYYKMNIGGVKAAEHRISHSTFS